jgi:RHS repeat-associated protein
VEKTGYDALNRVLTSTDAAGQTTVYSYDLGGTLHGLTDAKGNAYVYAYDALNRKMRTTYPDGSHEDWEYDAVGNNLTYTTRGGQQLGSVFDARNRVTDSVWSDGTPSVTRTYDAAGRLLSAQSSVSALTYIYDAANQLLSETQVVAAEGVAHTVAYSYDMDGNRSRMVAPSGLALDYAYTARNQVAAVSADGPPPIATYTYDLNGNRIQRSLENGIVTNFTYDDARQLLSVDHCTAAGSLVRLGYAYDKLGNRTSQRWEDGRVDRYGYDPLSQLIQAQYAPLGATPTRKATLARTTKYAYDPVGNRLSVTDTAGLTPASYSTNALNQYTNVDGVALGYDANGNLTSRAGWSYAYDAQNRLVSARSATSSVTLAYDARNRCVQRTVDGVAAYLAYDGWTLLEERTAAGSLAARYVHGLGTDEPLAMLRADGRTLFYHQDGLGSVSALTDETGKLVERYLYDVYGAATVVDGTGTLMTGSLAGNRFLYTGREWIAEAGLYDYRSRVYSAQLGRFLQSDPIRFAGGDVNIYRYCGNNGVNWTDPTGLTFWSSFGMGVVNGAVTAAAVVGTAVAVVAIAPAAAGVVTGALFIGGAVGVFSSVYSLVEDHSADNWGYQLGAFTGAAIVRGVTARTVATKLSPEGHAPPAGNEAWSLKRDFSQRWRYDKGLSFSENWDNAMATGPNVPSAAGAIAFSGASARNLCPDKQ